MKSFTENRQTRTKTSIVILLFAVFILPVQTYSQEGKSKIDYSVKSNILDPDTLRADQKLIFWHFVELAHKQADELEPLKVKAEFAKLGITTDQRARFVAAFNFFDTSMTNHKKSVENWESMNLESESD